MPTITKLLVANRGEIACRVIRTAEAMGIPCVAVYSDADAGALHVGLASEAVAIGPSEAAASYLDPQRLLDAAALTGCDGLHPGYGFLSENADFVAACAEQGITFVGPPAEAVRVMGDKVEAKGAMIAAGVRCVPGFQGTSPEDRSPARLKDEADKVGYPLLVKAAAGGGGRGMRRVDDPTGLDDALATARSEAESAFGNGDLLLERLLEGARHVEVQVFADTHGSVIHLGERDCSSQRRHQKVIEESPCPVVDPTLRAAMGEAAVRAAQTIDYVGAGTVEFLLDGDGTFYFLEMNTRLQVEHPVTELVTGLDLVELQLRVAAGEPLGITQDEVRWSGHAMEARLYAEDPARGFLPATGPVLAWRPPEGVGVRCDHGLREGQEITAYYDPMVAKVISWGQTREEARRRLLMALDQTVLLGPVHNRSFLRALLRHPTFIDGGVTTSFLSERMDEGDEAFAPAEASGETFAVAAALWLEEQTPGPTASSAWRSAGTSRTHLILTAGADQRTIRATRDEHRGGWTVQVDDKDPLEVGLLGETGSRRRISVGGHQRTAHVAWAERGARLHLRLGEVETVFEQVLPGARRQRDDGGDGRVMAPMGGRILKVHVQSGDRVERGQTLLTLEAMKLETNIPSPLTGVVAEVRVSDGDQVTQRQLLVSVTEDDEQEE